MPELLDPTLAFACALVALAAVVRGFSGFGSAMIVMPGLSLIYPPVEALIVFALIETATTLQLLPQGLRDADRRRVLPLALGATLCLPLGWQVIVAVEPETMRRAIGAVVLLLVALLALGWRYRGALGRGRIFAVGCASGLLAGSTGMAGPPVILMLMSTPGSAAQVRGSLILFFAWIGLVLLAIFALDGRFDQAALLRAAVLLPFYLAGTWAGMRLFRRSGERHFRWAALVILAAVGLAALVA
ncbi:MAG: sulfite exporter TauE/SafE family protein [Tistlia sp.]|uniref:sulfite exporter TauE/SafE family protein n=1 Tax=Tistlia sp. TaxID=3057121 RepID=UPI0034A0D39A